MSIADFFSSTFANQHLFFLHLFWRTHPKQTSSGFRNAWSSSSSIPGHLVSFTWTISVFCYCATSPLFLAYTCFVITSLPLFKWPFFESFGQCLIPMWAVLYFIGTIFYLLTHTFVFSSHLWDLKGQGQTSLFHQQHAALEIDMELKWN